jgi:DNA recombination protein RmuC
VQLRRVVEMAGMVEQCDFLEQHTLFAEGGRLRPDLIVRLPRERSVVIDAKVPLAAYLDAVEATDDAVRDAKLRDHARQVRDHVQKLASKGYAAELQPAPEFVVMFLPGETYFGAALQYDPELIEYAAKRNVVFATPTTLIALLRAVSFGWTQEKLAANAREICLLGRELHERVRTLAGYFEKLRKGLDGAVQAYNGAVGSLESRVLVTARKLSDLGAGTDEEIETPEPIDEVARRAQAPELAVRPFADSPIAALDGASRRS